MAKKISLQKKLTSQVEQITSAEALKTIFNDPETYRKVCEIRTYRKAGQTKQAQQVKTSLPGIIFVADTFETTVKDNVEGKWRLQKAAHLNGLAVLDADHLKEAPREVFSRWTPDQLKQLGVWLVFITSSNEGIKVVFEARKEWGNLIENVREMAKQLNLTADESGKDASRMSFAPSAQAGDILYFDEEGLFGEENPEYDQLFGAAYREGNSSATASALSVKGSSAPAPTPSVKGLGVKEFSISDYAYKNVPLQQIIDCWLGGEAPKEGERHKTSLQLADELRYITDSNPAVIEGALRAQSWVDDIVKERGENVAQTVKSALAFRENIRIPQRMSKALKDAGVDLYYDDDQKTNLPYNEWARRLKAIKLGCYQPAIAYIDNALIKPGGIVTSSGMFDTLLTDCWYQNSKGLPQRLNCLDMVIGKSASGKGFAKDQDEVIMEVMRQADAHGRTAERNYKASTKARSTSSKEQKKEALVQPTEEVRYCPVKTSNNVLYHRMENASKKMDDGSTYYRHIYTFASELLSIVNASGSFQEKRDFYLHSFHNERNGVDYANNDSVNDTMLVHYNLVATGTRTSLKKFVNPQNIGDGLSTRLSCFVMPKIGFKMMPLMKDPLDMTAANEMKAWAKRFCELHGEIKGLDKLIEHVYTLTAEHAEDADQRGDDVTVTMCMRMQDKVMAICIPLVLSTQEDWEQLKQTMTVKITKQHLDFATLFFDILLRCEENLFGQMWQDYFANEERDCQVRKIYDKTSENFERLPTEFTTRDVKNVWGYSSKTTASERCKQLCLNGQAEKIKTGHFRKLVSAI